MKTPSEVVDYGVWGVYCMRLKRTIIHLGAKKFIGCDFWGCTSTLGAVPQIPRSGSSGANLCVREKSSVVPAAPMYSSVTGICTYVHVFHLAQIKVVRLYALSTYVNNTGYIKIGV